MAEPRNVLPPRHRRRSPQERHRDLPLQLLAGQPGAGAGLDRRRRAELTPPYQGAPQAVATAAAAATASAATPSPTTASTWRSGIGGSSTYNGANWAMLDIADPGARHHQSDRSGEHRHQRSERYAHQRPAGLLEEIPQGALRRRNGLGPERRRHGQHVQVEALLQHGDAGHRHSATVTQAGPRAPDLGGEASIPISRTRSGATTDRARLHLVQHRRAGRHVQVGGLER